MRALAATRSPIRAVAPRLPPSVARPPGAMAELQRQPNGVADATTAAEQPAPATLPPPSAVPAASQPAAATAAAPAGPPSPAASAAQASAAAAPTPAPAPAQPVANGAPPAAPGGGAPGTAQQSGAPAVSQQTPSQLSASMHKPRCVTLSLRVGQPAHAAVSTSRLCLQQRLRPTDLLPREDDAAAATASTPAMAPERTIRARRQASSPPFVRHQHMGTFTACVPEHTHLSINRVGRRASASSR